MTDRGTSIRLQVSVAISQDGLRRTSVDFTGFSAFSSSDADPRFRSHQERAARSAPRFREVPATVYITLSHDDDDDICRFNHKQIESDNGKR